MKTIIIGGVAGGASAAARLRRLDEACEIVILERGDFISFANCGLPYYIGGAITDKNDLTLQTPESFRKRFNIDVRVNNEAVRISPEEKTVTVKNLKSGEIYTESYDNLILSPGAEPIKPNIEGIDSNTVFTLRNIPDTLKIKEYIEKSNPKSAVVIGGGYIGVEMAENLKDKKVTVKMKAGEGGRTFGSVSTKEISAAAKEQLGLELDKKKMVVNDGIKALGTYEVPIKLHPKVMGTLRVKVTEQ